MTLKQLLTFFEGYYGEKYSGIFLSAMIGYLDGYSDDFYEAAASVVTMQFSRTFNKAPDIAVIKKNMDEISGAMSRSKLLLPEQKYEVTDNEREAVAQLMAAYRQTQKEKYEEKLKKDPKYKPGPMAVVLSKTLDTLVEINA